MFELGGRVYTQVSKEEEEEDVTKLLNTTHDSPRSWEHFMTGGYFIHLKSSLGTEDRATYISTQD